jgi:hypothetical protein
MPDALSTDPEWRDTLIAQSSGRPIGGDAGTGQVFRGAMVFRPHFHRGRVNDVGLLDRSLQAWIVDYNDHRPNNGNHMRGRTPLHVKRELAKSLRQTAA